MIPYIDPKQFNRKKTIGNYAYATSDIYSVGVLLWEISSGQTPFKDDVHDIGLALEIIEGLRETPAPDTPKDYIKIYTGKRKFKLSNNYNCIILIIKNLFFKYVLFRVLGW